MLTHLGGNRYEFLMQLLIVKDLVGGVVVVDSYEGFTSRGRLGWKLFFVFLFFFPCVMVKRGEGWGRDFFLLLLTRWHGVNDPVFGL